MPTARPRGRTLLLAIVCVCLLPTGGASARPSDACSRPGWVGGWATAQAASSAMPGFAEPVPRVFLDQSLRVVVTPTVAGDAVRLRFTNRFGDEPVVLDDIHVGVQREGATIVPGSNRPVRIGGAAPLTIPPGGIVVTDPVQLPIQAFTPLAVSFHVAGPSLLDQHPEAWQHSWTTDPGAGAHGADEAGGGYTRQVRAWYALDAVDVLAPRQTAAVVALGDSITDGSQSTYDANRRYPDQLARRLGETRSGGLSVLNAGIGANQVSRSTPIFGPAGAARVSHDVLSRTAVGAVVLLEGINDIALFGSPHESPGQASERVITGYRSVIAQARAHRVLVLGGTLTPAGRNGTVEDARTRINAWIRDSGAFDAVVDFDAALRDPQNPHQLLSPYDSGDGLHPNDAGYAAMADAVDLSVLRRVACR